MKLYLIALVLSLGACATKAVIDEKSKYNLVDHKVVSLYAGCIEGFMEVIKLDMYRRPKKFKTPKEASDAVKHACHYRSMLYQYYLEKSFFGKE